jgi:hypothetical protein
MYRFIAGTVLGEEKPGQRQRGQSLEEVVGLLAEALAEQ